jgi:hypothetical protein
MMMIARTMNFSIDGKLLKIIDRKLLKINVPIASYIQSLKQPANEQAIVFSVHICSLPGMFKAKKGGSFSNRLWIERWSSECNERCGLWRGSRPPVV